MTLRSVHRQRDNHGWSSGARSIAAADRDYLSADYPDSVAGPNPPKQRQLSADRRTRSFHSSFAGVNTREGGRLIEPLPPHGLTATKLRTLTGRKAGARSAVQAAPGCRLNLCSQPRRQALTDLPHCLSRLSSVVGFDTEIKPREACDAVHKFHERGSTHDR